MVKTVIFDFDGTIADTLATIITLFNRYSSAFNLPQIKAEDKAELRNLSAKELMAKYQISTWKFLQLNQKILTELKKQIVNLQPINGMAELLTALANNNFKIGILSSNHQENIQLFLQEQQLTMVDFVYSEKNLFGKDKVLKHLLKKYGFKPEEVIYVGDEVRDIEAAQKVGIAVMAVTWGLNSKTRLAQARPSYMVDKPEEILTKLKN